MTSGEGVTSDGKLLATKMKIQHISSEEVLLLTVGRLVVEQGGKEDGGRG